VIKSETEGQDGNHNRNDYDAHTYS